MYWKFCMTLLVTLAFLAPQVVAQHVEERTYEVAGQSVSWTGNDSEAAMATTDGTLDIGGARFTALPGETHVTIVARDASGTAPHLTACQDVNDNSVCGEPGEPRVSGCGTLEVAIPPTGGEIIVFVTVQSAATVSVGHMSASTMPCGLDGGVGTTGTLTATFV